MEEFGCALCGNALASSVKSVKLKQEVVSKLQEIVASRNLDTKGIFANYKLQGNLKVHLTPKYIYFLLT